MPILPTLCICENPDYKHSGLVFRRLSETSDKYNMFIYVIQYCNISDINIESNIVS